MISTRSPWRPRLGLLAALLVLLLVNVGVLVAYSGFAESRVRALEEERKTLESRRDAARLSMERLDESVRRLEKLQEGLDRFNVVTLGTRKDRLAPLIEEIHTITKKAGLLPDAISYAEQDAPGGDTIHLTFGVTSSYADIKRLLATFESSAKFLVVDSLGLGVDESGSDLLTVHFGLSHYFREVGGGRRRIERAALPGEARATPSPATRSVEARPARSAPEGHTPLVADEPAGASRKGGGVLLPHVATAPGVASAPRPRRTQPARELPDLRAQEAPPKPRAAR